MSLSMYILRSFHHKGAYKGELVVEHRGLGPGAVMSVCERTMGRALSGCIVN